ncbi:MAG: Hsp20/alpha crystallin family protein [Bacteroidota bacterium]
MEMVAAYEQKLPSLTLDALRGDDFFGARLLDFESELFTLDWKNYMPSVNITADARHFYIDMPVSGFDQQDFSFECENGILFIAAEKTINTPQEESLLFRRSFSLPENAATEGIQATVNHGRLNVAIPKL